MLNLTSCAIRRHVIRELWLRAKRLGEDKICGFGFGIGLKDGEIDLETPFCVRAYVTKKKQKNSRAKWKPKLDLREKVTVPIEAVPRGKDQNKRRVKGMSLTIPTDVHEVGDLVGSGRVAVLDGDPSQVTTGVVVRWKVANEPTARYGVVTVAHGFDPSNSANAPKNVTIIDNETHSVVRGERVAELRAQNSGVDLTLIEVDPSRMISAGLVTSISLPSVVVRSYADLEADGGAAGIVRQAEGRAFSFTVIGTIDSENFGGVGKVINLVHARAPKNAFVKGTSGSPFSIVNLASGSLEPAGIQIGADERSDFRDGYAQALATSLNLLRLRLNENLELAGTQLESQIEVLRVF